MAFRPVWIVAAAVLLPVLVFAGVLTALDASNQRRTLETATLERARSVQNQVDAHVGRTVAALEVLSTIQSLRGGDWAEATRRAEEVRKLHGDWRAVRLVSAEDGAQLFVAGVATPPPPLAATAFVGQTGRVEVDGIRRAEGRCTCALVGKAVQTAAGPARLIVELDPAPFQQTLMAETPDGAVAAVVDREGRFLARSVAFAERVGTPATRYVRGALSRGPEGVYSGKTYEGLVNYTAFVKSPLTGWSTHVAVSSALVEDPQLRWWVAISLAGVAALAFAGGLLWLGLRSLAAQRAVEERLRAAERMEALGKLTGGVAHDFNNMLAIIVGSLDLAQRRLASGNPNIERQINVALEGATRAAGLVRQMLAFARRQPLAPEVVDPSEVLSEMRELLVRTIGEDIAMDCRVQPGTKAIRVDRVQLENAIVNLAANARDAMPDGGRLTILASNAVGPSRSKRAASEAFVAIEVIDNGAGMPEAVRARALEPFFTTKEAGRGTGLGLSQIYGFVQQSNGEMRIESAPGQGTRVVMLFPGVDEARAPAAAELRSTTAPSRLRGRILLVEDEDAVRETLREALVELGHDVESAASPKDALARLDAVSPDLVLSDVVMPGMNGQALARAIRERRPEIAVLLMSAYAPDADPEPDSEVRLRKPFTLIDLDQAVTRALESAQTAPGRD